MWNWSRAKPERAAPTEPGRVLGLDLTAARARAVIGVPGRTSRRLVLDDPHDELPLAVSLERPKPEAGRAGLAVSRRLPHLACQDFLAHVGLPREWKAGRHRLDATALVGLVLDRLRPLSAEASGVALAVPAYLSPAQVKVLAVLFDKVRLPVVGSAATPLALAAYVPWDGVGSALVVDADDHGLSVSLVRTARGQARLAGSTTVHTSNLRMWKARLLDGLADRCVRLCRRDPRDSAVTEQAVYDQLDDAMDRAAQGQRVDVAVRSEHWYQTLTQSAEEFDGLCVPLVRSAVSAVREAWAASAAGDPPDAVWLTHAAGRLPGLARALHGELVERAVLKVLPADAAAQAALVLAGRVMRGELPSLHLDTMMPLPAAPPAVERPMLDYDDPAPPADRPRGASRPREV